MQIKREVVQMALDALVEADEKGSWGGKDEYADVISVLHEALAQPEPEPFGYYEDDFGFNFPGFFSNQKELLDKGKLYPLYLAPPAPKVPDGWKLVPIEPILTWLENQYGLHKGLDITYVVDGYEVEFTYDGNPTDGRIYHGETLSEALQKAMLAAAPTSGKE